METEIKALLIKLMEAISKSDAVVILDASAALDNYTVDHKGLIDPQLLHFLRQRSYEKALQFLSGVRLIPAGICGGIKTKQSSS